MRCRQLNSRPGFSFAEVMFAVVILGIGFVMVTAVFPVAVEQTRSTNDDAAATKLAQSMARAISTSTHAADYPDNGGITQAYADVIPLWEEVSGNSISADGKYACVPFFSKSPNDGSVRVSVLVVRRWIHDSYTAVDISGNGELVPRGVKVANIIVAADGTQQAQVTKDDSGAWQSIAPGTFLVMRSGDGNWSGHAFRLSQLALESTDSVLWTIEPDTQLLPGEDVSNAYAAVIGKDFADPANPQSGFAGPSQDLAIFTTYLQPQ